VTKAHLEEFATNTATIRLHYAVTQSLQLRKLLFNKKESLLVLSFAVLPLPVTFGSYSSLAVIRSVAVMAAIETPSPTSYHFLRLPTGWKQHVQLSYRPTNRDLQKTVGKLSAYFTWKRGLDGPGLRS